MNVPMPRRTGLKRKRGEESTTRPIDSKGKRKIFRGGREGVKLGNDRVPQKEYGGGVSSRFWGETLQFL